MPIRTPLITAFLDDVRNRILAGDVSSAMTELFEELRAARESRVPQEWKDFTSECARHPIRDLLHQDPITKRCWDKPRGYAGDAVLLDMVYGLRPVPCETSPLGKEIYQHNYATEGCRGVRERKRMVGSVIDRLAGDGRALDILSLACGHLREAMDSRAIAKGVCRVTAIDQDPLSLAVIERELPWIEATIIQGTVKQILQGRLPLKTFDLVYAVGLYDYLYHPVARALTTKLFQHVGPGGTLLIPNLTPDVAEVGYMEAFMGWHMIYRDEWALEDAAAGLPISQIEKRELYRDPTGMVLFLEVEKKR